ADDADDRRVVVDAELAPQLLPRGGVAANGCEIDSERHDRELLGPADAEPVAYLMKLLLAQHQEAIRVQPRQRFLDGEEEPRLQPAVVTVKDVAVIRVDEAASSRTPDEQRRCEKAVHQPRHAPDR